MNTAGENPFILTRATCPVCRTVNEFATIRAGAYIEDGIDTDFRPQSRRWTNPRYQAHNPLLYFMATCTTCFYTRELNRTGGQPQGVNLTRERLNRLRQRHLTQLADASSVSRRLGAALWPESYPTQTAIAKLLLGVFSEMLDELPSDTDLARWYLRMAWLFRELDPRGGGEVPASGTQNRKELLLSLTSVGGDLRRLRARVDGTAEYVTAQPGSVQSHADDHQSVSQCRQKLQQIVEGIDSLDRLLTDLNRWVAREPGRVISSASEPLGEPFGEHPSFTEFLRALKLDSPLVPVNEDEAMLHALAHYKRPFEARDRLEFGTSAIMTAYMIGELSRRLGRFDDAERHLVMARDAASESVALNGRDKAGTALARHIVALADGQIRHLYDLTAITGSQEDSLKSRNDVVNRGES